MAILNTTISTYSPEWEVDAQGTDVANFDMRAPVDVDVSASVQQMSQAESFEFKRQGFEVDYEVFTRAALAAAQNSRLVTSDGQWFQVVIASEDMAGRGRMYCTRCKLLKVV